MNIVRRYGLITGLIWANLPFVILYSGIRNTTGASIAWSVGLLFFIVFIFLAIRNRKQELGGYIDFREGFRSGLGVTIMAAIIGGLGTFIYYRFADVHSLDAQIPAHKRDLIASGLAPEQAQEKIDSYLSMYPFMQATSRLALLIFVGGIISIVVTMLLRRQSRQGS